MKLQRLLSYVRQAVDDYRMIDSGDVIAVGVSGGKDSLALLYALKELQHFYPNPYTIKAITVDLGLGNQNTGEIEQLCKSMEIEYYIVRTEIGTIIFKERHEKNPCSLCAKMRKGALNNEALRIGCNKIAYAHHQDDAIEIRPFIYIRECNIIGFQNKYLLPVAKNPCPADGNTKRQYIKSMLANINRENPGVKERLFHSIINGTLEEWNLPYS